VLGVIALALVVDVAALLGRVRRALSVIK
jgi:hypothetical protein